MKGRNWSPPGRSVQFNFDGFSSRSQPCSFMILYYIMIGTALWCSIILQFFFLCVPGVGNGWAMQEELVSLLKTAGRLCLERQNDTGKSKADPLCTNLTFFLRNTLTHSVTVPTERQTPWAGTTSWADNTSWATENGTWGFGNSTAEPDPNYDNLFMAALSVILGIVILITVIGE